MLTASPASTAGQEKNKIATMGKKAPAADEALKMPDGVFSVSATASRSFGWRGVLIAFWIMSG